LKFMAPVSQLTIRAVLGISYCMAATTSSGWTWSACPFKDSHSATCPQRTHLKRCRYRVVGCPEPHSIYPARLLFAHGEPKPLQEVVRPGAPRTLPLRGPALTTIRLVTTRRRINRRDATGHWGHKYKLPSRHVLGPARGQQPRALGVSNVMGGSRRRLN
jgi:hypothetical protein